MKKLLCFVLLISVCLGTAPRKTRWVALGDSITCLNDHLDQTGNRLTRGYLTLLTENNSSLEYVNKGFNGWSAVKISQKIDSLGLVEGDVYTVFLGTNDWWQGQGLGKISDYRESTGSKTFYGAFRIITDKIRRLNRYARIILITPMQRGDFISINNFKNTAYGSYKPRFNQTLEQFSDAVEAIGRLEGFAVVDLYHDSGITIDNVVNFKRLCDPVTNEYRNYTYPAYTTIPFDSVRHEYPYPPEAVDMTYDGLHPSDRGSAIIAKMLQDTWPGFR